MPDDQGVEDIIDENPQECRVYACEKKIGYNQQQKSTKEMRDDSKPAPPLTKQIKKKEGEFIISPLDDRSPKKNENENSHDS